MTQNRRAGVDVSAETYIPAWDGEPMDDDLVVEALYRMSLCSVTLTRSTS